MDTKLDEHLKSRRFDKSIYSAVWCDVDCMTVGLWNLTGSLVGYQQYKYKNPKDRQKNPRDMKYFTFAGSEGCSSRLSAFGVDLLNKNDPVLFLVEGIFDATPLHNKGRNALAVLGNDQKNLRNWIDSMNYYVVALCDSDPAGLRLGNYAHTVVRLPEGRDPADMSDEWFDELINKYCKEMS